MADEGREVGSVGYVIGGCGSVGQVCAEEQLRCLCGGAVHHEERCGALAFLLSALKMSFNSPAFFVGEIGR